METHSQASETGQEASRGGPITSVVAMQGDEFFSTRANGPNDPTQDTDGLQTPSRVDSDVFPHMMVHGHG